jgi:hypothetical protein
MDDAEHQPGPALFKTAVGKAITAVIGSIALAVSLLVFVLNLLVTTEIGIGGLIVSFVVCGVGFTTGLIVLRRLFPRREPISIFAGPIRLSVQAASRATVRAQTGGCLPDGLKSARPVHAIAQISPVMKTHGSESIATYNTHDVAGALGLVTIIGLGSGLATRFSDGWQFLSITAVAGMRSGPGLVLAARLRRLRIPDSGHRRSDWFDCHSRTRHYHDALSCAAVFLRIGYCFRRGHRPAAALASPARSKRFPDPAPCFAGRFLTYNAN